MTLLVAFATIPESCFIHCSVQWGSTGTPANYTCVVTLPIACQAFAVMATGVVATSDNNAKVVSNVFSATTSTSITIRSEQVNAPASRYILVGKAV